MKLNTQNFKDQTGITLMLSVLVLSAILAIAFSLATVTFIEIRSSGDLIRTEPAYYSAEAVSEEALFKIKRNLTDQQLAYGSSLNNVSLSSQTSSLSTPIFQAKVSKTTNTFSASTNRYPIFDSLCPAPATGSSTPAHCAAGGSGYSRIKLTYLDTGNSTDQLRAYLCQFDPRKSIDPTGTDTSAYRTMPCSDPSDTQSGYWLVYNDSLSSNNTREGGVLGGNWPALDPYQQQELILYNSGGGADIYAQIETSDENGIPKGLPLVGSKAVDISASSFGVVRKIRTNIPTGSNTQSVSTGTDTLWFDDAVPSSATQFADGDTWNWVSSSPVPNSGSLYHKSALVSGIHQHFFNLASGSDRLILGASDKIYTYVYIAPGEEPTHIMLQWYSDSWEHRAYWGNQGTLCVGWGSENTDSRRYMGTLPVTGSWVRLEVPVGQVGLSGATVIGMAFSACGGRVSWDTTGKNTP